MTNTVIFRTNPVVFRTNPVIFWTKPVIFRTNPVIFRTNPVIFRTNPVYFRSKPVILGQIQSCLGHLNKLHHTALQYNALHSVMSCNAVQCSVLHFIALYFMYRTTLQPVFFQSTAVWITLCKKSRIREKLNLSTDADRITDTKKKKNTGRRGPFI